MSKLSPKPILFTLLGIAAVALLVAVSFPKGEPASGAEDRSVSPVIDEPTASPSAGSARMLVDRKPSTIGRGAGTSRIAGATDMASENIGNSLQGVLNSEAETAARLALFKEEFKALIKGLNTENARATAEAIEQKNFDLSSEMRELYEEFYSGWAAFAGAEAMDFNEKAGGKARFPIMAAWAKSEPEAAKAYAAKQSKPGNVRSYEESLERLIVKSVAETNLDDAIAYSLKNESDSANSGAPILAEKISEQRGAAGIESWLSLVEQSYAPGEAQFYRNQVAEEALERLRVADRERAREWLVRLAARGVISAESMDRIASNNRLTNGPEDELALLATASPANANDAGAYSQLVANRFGEYLKRDFAAAGAWIAKQPRDARNDGAIQKFALAAAGADREAALEWVQQISDERLREATLAMPEFSGNASVVRPQKP